MVPLAAEVTGGGPLAIVVTFLVVSGFYAVTLHLAALFFVGDVPSQRAATVAPVPAIVSLLLGRWGVEGALVPSGVGVAITIVATLAADALAIGYVYRLRRAATVALTLLHFAFAAVLGVALSNLFGLV